MRFRKMIKPALQLKVILAFLLLAGISAFTQAIILSRAVGTLAGRAGEEESRLLLEARELVASNLLLSFAIVTPVFLLVGVLVTHRIAGPVYRFEQHLRQIAEGKDPGACRIRPNDELHELCNWINKALERMRGTSTGAQESALTTKEERIPA
jgi:methyl-accepting chemotaxis protein